MQRPTKVQTVTAQLNSSAAAADTAEAAVYGVTADYRSREEAKAGERYRAWEKAKADVKSEAGDERTESRYERWNRDVFSGDAALFIPEPPSLIDGWLNFDSTNVIYGQMSTYKTFVGLDMALSVVCGLEWQGHTTTQCGVAYVLTEGRGGISKRIAAWMEHHGIDTLPMDFVLLTAPVALLQEECADDFADWLKNTLKYEPPGFIVFDTLSRVLGSSGQDEQGNMSMQAAVDASDAVNVLLESGGRRAATLWVAHTGWASDHVRGGSAFQSGVSTAILVEADKKVGTVTLKNPKQRDEAASEDLHLTPLQVGRSMVLTADDRAFAGHRGLTRGQLAKLRLLCDAGTMTITMWAKAAKVSDNSFKRIAGLLCDAGYAAYSAASGLYTATNAGRGECGLPLDDD